MSFQRYDFDGFLARYIDESHGVPLLKLLEHLPSPSENGPWIAGGAVRRTLMNREIDSDIDYFFRDADQAGAFDGEMEERGWLISEKEHVMTYGTRVEGETVIVQAIKIAYYPTIEDVLDSFDFTITQFGYDGKDLVCGEFSLWDLARKRLALHRLTYGVSTVRRLIKYTRQGFTACGGALAQILEETVANPEVIHRETTYVD